MNERELIEWKARNKLLQEHYREYLNAGKKQSAKDSAFCKINLDLEWPPFMNYISNNPMAFYSRNSKYGLDYITECCISEIDEIANGIRVFNE